MGKSKLILLQASDVKCMTDPFETTKKNRGVGNSKSKVIEKLFLCYYLWKVTGTE